MVPGPIGVAPASRYACRIAPLYCPEVAATAAARSRLGIGDWMRRSLGVLGLSGANMLGETTRESRFILMGAVLTSPPFAGLLEGEV